MIVRQPLSARARRFHRRIANAVAGALAAALLCSPSAVRADAVADWYAVTQTVREAVPPASDASVEQVSPLVALAMYDAIAAIDGGHRPYLGPLDAPPGASAEAAAHAAAHKVLVETFPRERERFDQLYANAIGVIGDSDARAQGIAVGEAAATRLLVHRVGHLPAVATAYRPATEPGVFVPPQLPVREWIAGFRPFVLRDLEAFRTPGPPALASAAYARDYAEVLSVGERNSSTRTDEQTRIAQFWNKTGLAQLLSQFFHRPGRTLAANARLYAIYATAEFDMAIVLVREKYWHNYWRPVTAIRNGDRDENPLTNRDERWEPLLATPAHPDYPCGHCLVGALTATIMSSEFGPAPPEGFTITSAPDRTTRHYASFAALDAEITGSRIWGGVHFRTGAADGADLGRRIAQHVIETGFESGPADVQIQDQRGDAMSAIQ